MADWPAPNPAGGIHNMQWSQCQVCGDRIHRTVHTNGWRTSKVVRPHDCGGRNLLHRPFPYSPLDLRDPTAVEAFLKE